MKKSPIILIALALLSLVGSTYAANSGADSVVSNDPSTITVTTETSLISETPITDVSVSNVVKQDGIVVSESTNSAPVVDTLDLDQQAKMAVMARGATQEIPPEMLGFLGLMFIFPILMFVVGILFSIFWLWMIIDAIKHETEQKTLWIIVLFLTNGIGAILYYFIAKRPRDKANKLVEVISQAAPVAPSEPIVETSANPEVVSVNPEPVIVPSEVVAVQTPESANSSSDQPVNPLA